MMDEYGIGFHLLEKIQHERNVPDEEMRRRNLLLSKLDKRILDEVPLCGPAKDMDYTECAKLHRKLNRALPASLLLDMHQHPNFPEWIANMDMRGEERYIALRTFFLDLNLGLL